MTHQTKHRGFDTIKRILDIVAASVSLLLISPVAVLVALLVRLKLGRPVLFVQDRPGLNGKVFRLYKFRTMKNVSRAAGLVTDEQRLTPFGRSLRASSLDEILTLINVVKGDMSFVGPRPLLVKYLNRYTSTQARRHEVRPGITGLAQASGRNGLTWARKLELDVEYVDNRSFFLDFRILAQTVLLVVKREGVSSEGHATSSEFMGHKSGQGTDK